MPSESETKRDKAKKLFRDGTKVSEIALQIGVSKSTVYSWKSKYKWDKSSGVSDNDNLIPLNRRTKEEQKEICTKGGKASGAARRKIRDMKMAVRSMLSLPISAKDQAKLWNSVRSLGTAVEDMDYLSAIIASMIAKATSGDVKAAQWLRDTAGYNPTLEFKEKQFELEKLKTEVYIDKMKGCLTIEEVLEVDDISENTEDEDLK